MKITQTSLDGVVLLSPPQFPDERGTFCPVFAQRWHTAAGYSHPWAEMNLSHTKAGCIRGLHFQQPQPQAKLITLVSGSIFDVVVDLRPGESFGKHETFLLSANHPHHPSQIYLPEGFAHGFATPQEPATIAYLVSTPWNDETEQVLAWNDPDLAIPWPVHNPELSPRDQNGTSWKETSLLLS